jgi:hypothetical protein
VLVDPDDGVLGVREVEAGDDLGERGAFSGADLGSSDIWLVSEVSRSLKADGE